MRKRTETSQRVRVLQYMKQHGSITSMEAFEKLNITRLAAVISLLKLDGVVVKTTIKLDRNEYGNVSHWAVYTLEEDNK